MHPVPLAVTTRGYPDSGYVTENIHIGSVAVVDADGRLLWCAGNPDYPTFTRSALKPFQALPFVLDGGVERLKLSRDELALLCASHSGEDKHVQMVRALLERIGLDEHHLECGCQVPLYYDTVNLPAPPDRRWTALHHNCSGKHSGFLAWCRLHGAPTERYVDPRHPLQRAIRERLAEAVQIGADQLPTGIDGCSAPNYSLPLFRLAHLYARLAQGERDAYYGGAFGMLFDAMTARPDLVSGEERSDLHLMTAGRGDWVCKVGADAVQAVGVRSAGVGIAIKITDGASRALHTVTYHVLDQLGLMDEHARQVLERFRQPPIKNARGIHAGDVRAVFELTKAA